MKTSSLPSKLARFVIILSLSIPTLSWAQSSKEAALDAANISSLELVRRQEALLKARQLIAQGEAYLSGADYENAAKIFDEANGLLSKAPATSVEVQQISRGRSIAYYELARASYEKREYEQTTTMAAQAYQADPENRDALGLHDRAAAQIERQAADKGAIANSPQITNDEFVAKQKKVLELYRAYENYYKSEQFDQAEIALKDILRLDPYSATAYHRLREVQMAKYRKLAEGQTQFETQGILEVRKGWLLPIRRDRITSVESGGGEGGDAVGQKNIINKKLNSIIIKSIEFQDTPILSAIKHLVEESRQADPEKKGVNIVPNFTEAAAEAPPPPPATNPDGTPAAPTDTPAPSSFGTGPRKVTLTMRDVPLITVIKYLTTVTGLKYRVEPEAVVLTTGSDVSVRSTQTRTFQVKPGVFKPLLERADAGAGAGGGGGSFRSMTPNAVTMAKPDVKKVFEEYGIQFPAGTGLQFNDALGILVATHSNEVLDQIEQIIYMLNQTPPQVTIEAKFMEVRQTDLDELGFRWRMRESRSSPFIVESGQGTPMLGGIANNYVGSGNEMTGGLRDAATVTASALDALLAGGTGNLIATAGANTVLTLSSIASNPQIQVFINALSQKQAVNLLSAPRVTTLSGESAKILVTREFIYPSAYSDPQVQVSSGGQGTGAAVTAPSPTSFTTREVGVILDVKPTVSENTTINLTLSPEVVDFEGFINYNTSTVVNDDQFTFTIPQPLFNKRQLTTSVIIWDGQTVVLGGLIRDDQTKVDDKIPLLGDLPLIGRLFRSKLENSIKKNLIIFLHAQIVDPSGKPIRPVEEIKVLDTTGTAK
jgi:general secretion pathway protein D